MQRSIKILSMMVLLGLIILWAGCGSGKVQLAPSIVPASVPEWYNKPPEDPGYLYAAAAGTDKDIQQAAEKAKSVAKNDIASQLGTRIETQLERRRKEVVAGGDSVLQAETQINSKEIIQQSLKGCRTVRQSPPTKEGDRYRVYVLMRMPTAGADNALEGKFEADRNAYSQFQEEIWAFRELNQGEWKYDEAAKSALDDAAREAADDLAKAEADQKKKIKNIKNIVVAGVTRWGYKDIKAHNSISEAISDLCNFTIIAGDEDRNKILRELDLIASHSATREWQETGFVASDQATKVGEALSADALVYGEIENGERGTQQLHLNMLTMESTEYSWKKRTIGHPNRSKMSAIGWSLLPGGGHFYNFRPTRGILLGGLQALGIGAAILFYQRYVDSRNEFTDVYDKYMNANKITEILEYEAEASDLFDRKNTRYDQSILAAAIPVGILLYNMCVAYLDAQEYQKKRYSESQ